MDHCGPEVDRVDQYRGQSGPVQDILGQPASGLSTFSAFREQRLLFRRGEFLNLQRFSKPPVLLSEALLLDASLSLGSWEMVIVLWSYI